MVFQYGTKHFHIRTRKILVSPFLSLLTILTLTSNRDVGFLKYWTLNQLPLFLLAAPVLGLLISSSTSFLRDPSRHSRLTLIQEKGAASLVIRSLASMQLFIAVLAITNYHVQIITRLASAYPVWYWWIASSLLGQTDQKSGFMIATFMIMYAGVQGSLFASFLPPA